MSESESGIGSESGNDNPFAKYAKEGTSSAGTLSPGASDNPFQKYVDGSHRPSTAGDSSSSPSSPITASGLAASASRGLAPIAAGAGIGAVLGAPFAGIGAIPGAAAGAGAAALTEIAAPVYKKILSFFTDLNIPSPQEATDKFLDSIGVKKPSNLAERMTEATAGGIAGAGAPVRAAENIASSATAPLIRGIAERVAEKPATQLIAGGLGGIGGQTGSEFNSPLGSVAGSMTAPLFAGLARRSPAVKDLRTENAARKLVNADYSEGVKGGAPDAVTIMEHMNKAREEGQPYTLADAGNLDIQGRLGSVYRAGGGTRQKIAEFLQGRNDEQRGRVRGLISRYLSDESARETVEELITLRSNTGKAFFNQAFQGGSLAPLEQQYQAAWVKAGQDEAAAAQRLAQAHQLVVNAAAKKSQAGNVYSSNAAGESMRDAQLALKEAQDALSIAREDKQMTLDKLQSAQIDRQTNAPGGIWSPYLMRIHAQPEIPAAIKKGIAIQRRDAVGENRPFNPTEYALDQRGRLISVPNMRTWSIVKKGLDGIVESKRNEYGKLSEDGVSWAKFRDGLVGELDRLNPDYKTAREHWGGYTASMRALERGQKFLLMSPEDMHKYVSELEPGDKQFFIMGLTDTLKNRLRTMADSSDKARVINNDMQERLRTVFGSDEEASRFMDAIEREHEMKRTPQAVYGGSPTAGRLKEDTRRWYETAGHGLRALWHLSHGNPMLGVALGARSLGRAISGRQDPALNEKIARLILDPDISQLIARGRAAREGNQEYLLPLEQLPQSLQQQITLPAAIGGAFQQGQQRVP